MCSLAGTRPSMYYSGGRGGEGVSTPYTLASPVVYVYICGMLAVFYFAFLICSSCCISSSM